MVAILLFLILCVICFPLALAFGACVMAPFVIAIGLIVEYWWVILIIVIIGAVVSAKKQK
jgi:hypothetical protein